MNKNSDTVHVAGADSVTALLGAVRAGSNAALVRLFSQYEGLLRNRAAVFSRNAQEAEEAYVEGCLALHRAALRYCVQEQVTFGLYAKICIDNALKTKSKRDANAAGRIGGRSVDFVPFEESRFFAYFSDPMIEEEEVAALRSLIRSELSAYERQVFDLYIQKVSVGEIAKQLGRDEKSIKNAISRLLSKLRRRLGR